MIEVQGLTQHYGVRPVLKDVTLQIDSGQIVAVVGPNGMGKSTLLAAIAGVLSPQHGKVKINGLARRASEADELTIRRHVVSTTSG
jgi:ABC-type cobalamin/Fe3+-siderophores transport system ATPase subunit